MKIHPSFARSVSASSSPLYRAIPLRLGQWSKDLDNSSAVIEAVPKHPPNKHDLQGMSSEWVLFMWKDKESRYQPPPIVVAQRAHNFRSHITETAAVTGAICRKGYDRYPRKGCTELDAG